MEVRALFLCVAPDNESLQKLSPKGFQMEKKWQVLTAGEMMLDMAEIASVTPLDADYAMSSASYASIKHSEQTAFSPSLYRRQQPGIGGNHGISAPYFAR